MHSAWCRPLLLPVLNFICKHQAWFFSLPMQKISTKHGSLTADSKTGQRGWLRCQSWDPGGHWQVCHILTVETSKSMFKQMLGTQVLSWKCLPLEMALYHHIIFWVHIPMLICFCKYIVELLPVQKVEPGIAWLLQMPIHHIMPLPHFIQWLS